MNYTEFIFTTVLPSIVIGVLVFLLLNWMIMYLPDILKYILTYTYSRLKFLRLTRKERERARYKKKMLRRKAMLDRERYKANELAKARLRQNAWE